MRGTSEAAHMALLKLLALILMFNELLVDLDAKNCPKGHKVGNGWNGCEVCSEGSYQDEEKDSQSCKPCRICDEKTGSEMVLDCSPKTNRVCRCRREFVAWEKDSSTCKCEKGFGLSGPPEFPQCSKCEKGQFSTDRDTPCKKWKDCKSAGVLINGTTTSDVVCNEEQQSASYVTTQDESMPLTTPTNQRPHEGAQTLKMLISITTRAPQKVTVKGNQPPIHPPNTGNQSGVAFSFLGIAGILLILTAVICKLHFTPCWKKTAAGSQTKDSMCRKPVEESGDGSELSLKQHTEEP